MKQQPSRINASHSSQSVKGRGRSRRNNCKAKLKESRCFQEPHATATTTVTVTSDAAALRCSVGGSATPSSLPTTSRVFGAIERQPDVREGKIVPHGRLHRAVHDVDVRRPVDGQKVVELAEDAHELTLDKSAVDVDVVQLGASVTGELVDYATQALAPLSILMSTVGDEGTDADGIDLNITPRKHSWVALAERVFRLVGVSCLCIHRLDECDAPA